MIDWNDPDGIATRRRELLQGAPGELDPEVVGVVTALRASGYMTFGSCAGHGGERGRISFIDFPYSVVAVAEVKAILKDFGLRDVRVVRVKEKGWWAGLKVVEVSFRGVA